MKPEGREPSHFSREGSELPLSDPAIIQLMQGVLEKGVPFRFRAKGFSMSPFVKDGDVITVESLPEGAPRLGHIVAFKHPGSGRLVVHRVVSKKRDGYLIKGDASPEGDGLVPPENILALVTRVEREGQSVRLGIGPTRLLIAFLTRSGLFLRLVIPAWLLVRPIVRRST